MRKKEKKLNSSGEQLYLPCMECGYKLRGCDQKPSKWCIAIMGEAESPIYDA